MGNTDIRKNVIESSFALARAMRRGPKHMEHNLPPAVERTLMVIAENDGLSAGELCELLDIRPSSASELSDKMSERGLVEKKADENDKRVSRIYLTELGKAQAAQLVKNRDDAISEFSGCFSDEEAEQFCTLANKLSAHLKELAGDAEGCGMGHHEGRGCHKGPHGGHGCHKGPHGMGHKGMRHFHRM